MKIHLRQVKISRVLGGSDGWGRTKIREADIVAQFTLEHCETHRIHTVHSYLLSNAVTCNSNTRTAVDILNCTHIVCKVSSITYTFLRRAMLQRAILINTCLAVDKMKCTQIVCKVSTHWNAWLSVEQCCDVHRQLHMAHRHTQYSLHSIIFLLSNAAHATHTYNKHTDSLHIST